MPLSLSESSAWGSSHSPVKSSPSDETRAGTRDGKCACSSLVSANFWPPQVPGAANVPPPFSYPRPRCTRLVDSWPKPGFRRRRREIGLLGEEYFDALCASQIRPTFARVTRHSLDQVTNFLGPTTCDCASWSRRPTRSINLAVREALGLAKSPLARYVPGWSGITPPTDTTR